MHVTSAAVPSAAVSRDGRIVRADPLLDGLLQVAPGSLVGRRLDALGAEQDDADGIAGCLDATGPGTVRTVRVTLRTDEQSTLHVQLVATAASDDLTVMVIDETRRVLDEQELASSQRRWLALARNAADIVFTTASDGQLTSVTSALPQRLGWAVDDVVGKYGLTFVHPDDVAAAEAAWLAVSAGHSSQETLEARIVRADKTVSWARLVITDLRDDPDVHAIVGNVTDITAEKVAEARRRHTEDRFRARFEQSTLPQAMQSLDGTFEAVNDAFCDLIARRPEEIVGRRPPWLRHPDDTSPTEPAVTMMLDRGVDSLQVDRLLQDAHGNPVPVRLDLTLLRDDDGAPSGSASAVEDLRPLRDSERARHELQLFFDVVAERSTDFVVLHDETGSVLYASPAGRRLFGPIVDLPSEEQISVVHPDDRLATEAAWEHVRTHARSHTWRYRAKNTEGGWTWVEQTSTNLLDTEVSAVVSILRDVSTEIAVESALRTSEARYRAIAETAEEGIVVISPDGHVTYANARMAAIAGIDLEDALNEPVLHRLDGETLRRVASRLSRRAERGPERYEIDYPHPDGSHRVLWIAASPMPDIDGEPQGSLAMISDITDMRRSEDELRHSAQHDHLTGLPNRTTLMQHLEGLSLADTSGIALLFVDLDHFKDVNDGRGHTAGDDLLIEVSARLVAAVRSTDLVARFGGDEFVVVLHDVDEQQAKDIATSVLVAVSQTYGLGHHVVRIGATIGVALSPASSADDLLRFADTAMYAAKSGGRGRVRLFDRALAEQAEERYILGADLLKALENDGLDLHYQPVVDVSTGEVVGVEALARWQHPTRGEIRPAQFIAVAELTASSTDLDRWVIRRALRDVAELKADHTMPDDAYVSINLSGSSLSDNALDAYIVDCVEDAGLDPTDIVLEITESSIMADKDLAIAVLQRLRDRGFDIAIDDFGTGYSSMAYLRDLPITVLKIDRGFVRGIPDDAHSLAIVTSLIELAGSLDLTVVAEGVETPAHLDALRARGCGLAQGWLWSPALSVAQLRSSKILTDRFAATDVRPAGL